LSLRMAENRRRKHLASLTPTRSDQIGDTVSKAQCPSLEFEVRWERNNGPVWLHPTEPKGQGMHPRPDKVPGIGRISEQLAHRYRVT
jgi:hypothetical protein